MNIEKLNKKMVIDLSEYAIDYEGVPCELTLGQLLKAIRKQHKKNEWIRLHPKEHADKIAKARIRQYIRYRDFIGASMSEKNMEKFFEAEDDDFSKMLLQAVK